MKQVTKVFKTDNDTILIVTASTEGCAGRNYVSVTANEIQPILRSEAIDRVREGLEDGEMWKMAVESDNTTMGLNEWVDWVISMDGELSGFDNSLYDAELTIEGEDYIFDSLSGGCLHDDIKAVTDKFNTLIEMHLNADKYSLKTADSLILSMQKDDDTDMDFMVEKYTREIIGIEA